MKQQGYYEVKHITNDNKMHTKKTKNFTRAKELYDKINKNNIKRLFPIAYIENNQTWYLYDEAKNYGKDKYIVHYLIMPDGEVRQYLTTTFNAALLLFNDIENTQYIKENNKVVIHFIYRIIDQRKFVHDGRNLKNAKTN